MPKSAVSQWIALISKIEGAMIALPGKVRSLTQNKVPEFDASAVTPQRGANPEYKDPALEENRETQKSKLKADFLKDKNLEKYKGIQDSTAKLMQLGFMSKSVIEHGEQRKKRPKRKKQNQNSSPLDQTHKR